MIASVGVLPIWPNAWLLTIRRTAHRASHTLQANCQSLKFLYQWSAEPGIDIESRMLSGQFLKSHEVASFAGAAVRHLDEVGGNACTKPTNARKVVSLEVEEVVTERMPPRRKGSGDDRAAPPF